MEIINSISTPVLKNLVVTNVANRTQLNVKFNVAFNHDGTPNEDQHFKNRYGYKIEILGYPDVESAPTSRDQREEQESHLFDFEKIVYRWVPTSNGFGSGFWGNVTLLSTLTKIYDLSGEPNIDGPITINKVTYVNQGTISQEIDTDLLDVNEALSIRLPRFFGGGVYHSEKRDVIFARVHIIDKRTRAVVGSKDSSPLYGFF